MAGQPMQQTFNRDIEEAGGVEYFLERYIGGESVASIAESFGLGSPFCVDQWRKKNIPDDVWAEAKRLKAEGLVDESLNILDNSKPATSAEATIAKERASTRRWIAGKLDRESWGDTNPADRALEAMANGWSELAEHISRNLQTLPPAPSEIKDADYELEPDDPPRLEGSD